MQTGIKISLAGHAALVGWAVFGAWFPSEPLPFEVQEVSLVSADEYARLSRQSLAPELSEQPAALEQPQAAEELPEPAAPQTPETPVTETAPPEALTPPEPDPQVTERPEPEAVPDAPAEAPAVPEQPDVAAVVPNVTAQTPQQRPADRVAPVPVAPPEPDTAVDEIEQPEVAPEEGAETEQEVQEATAPEAASDRIVTEENEGEELATAAPLQSVRPRARPARPEPAAEPAAQAPQDTVQDATASAVEDALAEALNGGGEELAEEPSGPPLTSGEKDALRVAVSQCWNVGSLSSDAMRTTVEVSVSMKADGRPDSGSIRMLSSTGGSAVAAKQAFEAARRAIIRCGARGFQLPPEKYAQWRDIVMTFNPERMRIR